MSDNSDAEDGERDHGGVVEVPSTEKAVMAVSILLTNLTVRICGVAIVHGSGPDRADG